MDESLYSANNKMEM